MSPMSRGNVQDGRRRPPSRKGNAINALTADDITRGLYEQQARQRRKIGAAVAALCTVLVTSGTARAAVMIHAAWQIATGSSIAGGRRTTAAVVVALGVVRIGIGGWLRRTVR